MVTVSPSFLRGMVAGILLWVGVVGLGYLLADVPAFIPSSIRLLAAVNLVAGIGGAFLVFGRERRVARLGAA